MKNIGEELRRTREGLGITLEEMSNRTKIAIDRLDAIENGDVGYFDDDISYLRYYIRFYCNALGLDFNQFRSQLDDSIEEFHTTVKLQKIEDNQEMEKSIQKQAKIHNLNSVIEKKIDVPMMSLIIVIIILLITLTSVFFIYILPQWQDPADNFEQADPIIETPVTEDPATETPITDPIVTTVSVTEIDSRTYQISGWTEGENVSLKINFGRDTWIKVFYDGVVTDNPASKTYLSGSEIEILYAAKTDGEIVISLGGMKGNTIYVNDALVQLDSTVTEYNSGIKLTFVLKGE